MNLRDNDSELQSPSIGLLIDEVSRLFRRRLEDETRTHGMTLPQWRALAHIARHPAITQRSLAEAIDADPMTVSGILDRLEKRGLVDRVPAPTDSRAKLARLTAEGELVYQTAREVGISMFDSATSGLTAAELDGMQSALRKMRDNLSVPSRELEEA